MSKKFLLIICLFTIQLNGMQQSASNYNSPIAQITKQSQKTSSDFSNLSPDERSEIIKSLKNEINKKDKELDNSVKYYMGICSIVGLSCLYDYFKGCNMAEISAKTLSRGLLAWSVPFHITYKVVKLALMKEKLKKLQNIQNKKN